MLWRVTLPLQTGHSLNHWSPGRAGWAVLESGVSGKSSTQSSTNWQPVASGGHFPTVKIGQGRLRWARRARSCFSPPFSTVQNHFYNWRDSGQFDRMMEALRALARAEAGRDLEPTAAVLDSQSAKTTETRRVRPRGGPRDYDAGKRIKGCKRQLAVDIEGSLIVG